MSRQDGTPKKREPYEKVLTIRMTKRQYEALKREAKRFEVRIVDVIRWLIDPLISE